MGNIIQLNRLKHETRIGMVRKEREAEEKKDHFMGERERERERGKLGATRGEAKN